MLTLVWDFFPRCGDFLLDQTITPNTDIYFEAPTVYVKTSPSFSIYTKPSRTLACLTHIGGPLFRKETQKQWKMYNLSSEGYSTQICVNDLLFTSPAVAIKGCWTLLWVPAPHVGLLNFLDPPLLHSFTWNVTLKLLSWREKIYFLSL